MHAHVCECIAFTVWVYVFMYVEAREARQVSWSISLLLIALRQGFSLSRKFNILPRQALAWARRVCLSPAPRVGVRGMCNHAQHFYEFGGLHSGSQTWIESTLTHELIFPAYFLADSWDSSSQLIWFYSGFVLWLAIMDSTLWNCI